MKFVLDANVIIAAFAARGLCESIMEVCLSEHEIVLGDDLLDEILRNLRHKIKLPSGVVDNIGALLREHSTISIPVPLASDVCRDPDRIVDMKNGRVGRHDPCERAILRLLRQPMVID